jgi:hypothetical protein
MFLGFAMAPSAIAGAWLPPQTVASEPPGAVTITFDSAALGASGDAAIAWSDSGGTNVQLRPAGGSWSSALPFPAAVSIGIDATGATRVAYAETVADGSRVMVATHTQAGWSQPAVVGPAGASAATPRIVVADDGTALVLWSRTGSPDLHYARLAADGTWTGETVADGVPAGALISVLPSGAMAFGWDNAMTSSIWVALASTQSGGFTPEPTANSGHLTGLQISPNGTVVVFASNPPLADLSASTRDPVTHLWQGTQYLIVDTADQSIHGMATTASPDGTISFDVWRFDLSTSGNELLAFSLMRDGSWHADLITSNLADIQGGYEDPLLATLNNGSLVAAYHDGWDLKGRIRDPNGVWEPVFNLINGYLMDTDYYPAAFLTSASGDALLISDSQTCGNLCSIYAVAYDGAAPRLTATVPDTGVVGQALAMSATAVDALSPLDAATTWAFDDGGTASGDSVSHAFASAGDHVVTISRADSLGQRAAISKTIHIALAPVHCPGPVDLPGGSTCPRPTVTKFTAAVVARWQFSRIHGAVTVRAHLGQGKLTGSVALRRPNGSTERMQKFSSRSDLRVSLPFPSLADPGRWSVRIVAKVSLGRLVRVTRAFTLKAPAEGVVRDAVITSGPGKPATLTLDRRLGRIYARFVFKAQPKAGEPISIVWYHGSEVVRRSAKPSRRIVIASLSAAPGGAPLQLGRWRCELRAGDRITKSVSFSVVG